MGTEPGCSFYGVSILTGTGSGQQMGKAEVQSGEGGHPAPASRTSAYVEPIMRSITGSITSGSPQPI